MPKNLNSYILKDRTIKSMKEFIDKTKIDKLERQFDLCLCTKDNTLFHMNECTGNQCSVISRKICVGGEFKGSYHTHPVPFSEKPSTGDLLNILYDGMGCIGSAKSDKIKCLMLKDKYKEDYDNRKAAYEDIQKVDDIETEIARGMNKKPELWPEISKKLDNLKEKNIVIDKYFKTIEIT